MPKRPEAHAVREGRQGERVQDGAPHERQRGDEEGATIVGPHRLHKAAVVGAGKGEDVGLERPVLLPERLEIQIEADNSTQPPDLRIHDNGLLPGAFAFADGGIGQVDLVIHTQDGTVRAKVHDGVVDVIAFAHPGGSSHVAMLGGGKTRVGLQQRTGIV